MNQRVLSAALIIISAGPMWCSDRGVRGAITDEANNALPGALVEVRCKQDAATQAMGSAKTDQRGVFVLRWDDSNVCALHVELAGFRPVDVALRSAGASGTLDIGIVRLKVGCTGPGVVCDSVTPKKSGGKGEQK